MFAAVPRAVCSVAQGGKVPAACSHMAIPWCPGIEPVTSWGKMGPGAIQGAPALARRGLAEAGPGRKWGREGHFASN